MTSGPDPGELPGFWGSMVFRHAPIPRKGSGKQQQQQEIKRIPLSADTICRRISEMSQDIECQLIDRVKRGKYEEELLMCVALFGTCTGEDIFSAVDTRLRNYGLSWECCISICIDGAGAMVGKHNGFLARVSQIAPHINFTHCIVHRENLASKTLDQQLKCVLDSAVKIVNCIKSKPFQTKLFSLSL